MRKVQKAAERLFIYSSQMFIFCVVIFVLGLQLLDAQNTAQDASCLPALKVSDIEPIIPYTPVQLGTAGKSAHTVIENQW